MQALKGVSSLLSQRTLASTIPARLWPLFLLTQCLCWVRTYFKVLPHPDRDDAVFLSKYLYTARWCPCKQWGKMPMKYLFFCYCFFQTELRSWTTDRKHRAKHKRVEEPKEEHWSLYSKQANISCSTILYLNTLFKGTWLQTSADRHEKHAQEGFFRGQRGKLSLAAGRALCSPRVPCQPVRWWDSSLCFATTVFFNLFKSTFISWKPLNIRWN